MRPITKVKWTLFAALFIVGTYAMLFGPELVPLAALLTSAFFFAWAAEPEAKRNRILLAFGGIVYLWIAWHGLKL